MLHFITLQIYTLCVQVSAGMLSSILATPANLL